jgi:hypothetical protein
VQYQHIYPLSSVYDLDADVFLASENLKSLSVERHEGDKLRLTARWQMYSDSGKPGDVRKWVLVVDPRNHYCVLDCQKYSNDRIIGQSLREIGTESGQLVCRKLTYAVFYPPGNMAKKAWESVADFTDHCFSDGATDAEFYLSNYGLPEPPMAPPPPKSSYWAWVMGGTAAALGVAALGFYYFGRRNLARPA